MLYHGSIVKNIISVKVRSKSHTTGEQVAYFTSDRVYALVCCRERTENFVTMGLGRDGKQHYFERFPNQLKVMYEGKKGYLYTPILEQRLSCTKGHTWESPVDVPVLLHEHVSDVYREIMEEERAGNVIVHRYEEEPHQVLKENANYLRDHLNDPIYAECRDFLFKHFSPLWD